MWAQEKVGLSDTIELGGCVMDGRVGARLRGGALVAVMCARVPCVDVFMGALGAVMGIGCSGCCDHGSASGK